MQPAFSHILNQIWFPALAALAEVTELLVLKFALCHPCRQLCHLCMKHRRVRAAISKSPQSACCKLVQLCQLLLLTHHRLVGGMPYVVHTHLHCKDEFHPASWAAAHWVCLPWTQAGDGPWVMTCICAACTKLPSHQCTLLFAVLRVMGLSLFFFWCTNLCIDFMAV